jgi:hypothetical protein
MVVGISNGFIVSKVVGYYTPFMYLGTILVSTATGLMATISPKSTTATWVGFQILFGAGLGMGLQQPLIAVQVVLKSEDAPLGLSAVLFGHTLGQTVFVSIAQNVLLNILQDEFRDKVPSVDPDIILNTGATSLTTQIPAADLKEAIHLYNYSITRAFAVAVGLSCFSIIGAALAEWKSVKKHGDSNHADENAPAQSEAT